MTIMNSGTATLSRENASGGQFLHASFVEWLCVQLIARSTLYRIWEVHDDNIEVPICALFKSNFSVVNYELRPWIFKRTSWVLRHVFSTHLNNVPIDINHYAFLYRWMFQDLSQSGSFATSPDEDTFRISVRNHSWLNETFMINMLINFCRLKEPISH